MTIPTYILKRLADDWKLLLSVFLGIAIAAALIAGAPVYINTLQRQGLSTAIDRSSIITLDIYAFGQYIPLNEPSLDHADHVLEHSVQSHVSEIYRGHENILKAPLYLVGLPERPLSVGEGKRISRGYFQHLTSLEPHVRLVKGRMGGDAILSGPRGPVVEAVTGTTSAELFDLDIGDLVTLAPSVDNPARVHAEIVGIVEVIDPAEEYWQGNARNYFNPLSPAEAPDAGINVDPREPPLPLFVTRRAMIDGAGKSFPGTLVNSSWYIFVDKERLKNWSMSETRFRLNAMESELSDSLQKSALYTGIIPVLDRFEQRSFFSSVPLLLLLAIMVLTVLYYLAMMVSYLVQSRENSVALLRSRGIGTLQLMGLYALEGIVLTVVAIVLAPFMAMGAVALAGKLPYFQEITGGSALPVQLQWRPFWWAMGAGFLSLVIFVVPGVLGGRSGLVVHKLRSSRPPSVPIFQRYYLDVALLIIGGLIFWEISSRGQLVSGGLFQEAQVNGAMLAAPVLLLIVVALVFMRFFPLLVRFVSGESATLLHLVAAATMLTLAVAIAAREVNEGSELGWLALVLVLAAVAGLHWASHQATGLPSRLGALVLQGAFVGLFVLMEPPSADEIAFVPTIGLISLVPAQAAFYLLRLYIHAAPVWVSMGLWHMARNPLQYSRLVLLLVLVTGLGVMAATVGGTLDRSRRERVLYDLATDIRVSDVKGYSARSRDRLRERYLTAPGVASVSLALRGDGMVGATSSGTRFKLLALESGVFPTMSWYRDDFSDMSLVDVMRELRPTLRSEAIAIPDGATHIGVWVKPEGYFPKVSMYMVIQDARGDVRIAPLGTLQRPEWRLMSADIPRQLEPPLQLISVQLFEGGRGSVATPGAIILDDIHVGFGIDSREVILEDFEGPLRWTSLPTSLVSQDSIDIATADVRSGNQSGRFEFGKDTDRGVRGFYRNDFGAPLPVVSSTPFTAASGFSVGDSFIVRIEGLLVPVVLKDTVDYFPTLDPRGGGFILADLDGIVAYLNMLRPSSRLSANELFIAEAPDAGQSTRDVVRSLGASANSVRDKGSLLESIRLDPLVTAGWKAMVLLSVGIVVFSAGLGYVTYLLSFAHRNRSEMGFLQSLGLSRRQMHGLLGLEHLVIASIGVGLGTWAGFQMSAIMVSSVAVTEKGERVVPPFILTTDWSVMLVIYGALAVIFLTALYRLAHGMSNMDLRSISRAEGH